VCLSAGRFPQARRNKLLVSWGPLVIAAPLAGSLLASQQRAPGADLVLGALLQAQQPLASFAVRATLGGVKRGKDRTTDRPDKPAPARAATASTSSSRNTAARQT